MPPIVTSAEIDRPAAEVFAYATDPARFSQWQKGVVDGHMEGPGNGDQTPSIGAKCVTKRRIGGASRPSTSELVRSSSGWKRVSPAERGQGGLRPDAAQAEPPTAWSA